MINTVFLVVDDMTTIRRLTRRAIETRLGAKRVLEAADGAEALEILKKENVGFIISDWEMPNVSGEEFLYEVRHNPKWEDIPFIMVTTHDERDFIMTAIQNGVSDYVVKPFSARELEDKVRRTSVDASKRRAERYYNLPPHQMVIKTLENTFNAQVVNLSRLGILIELDYHPDLKLCKIYEMSLEFERDDPPGVMTVSNLLGLSTRLELENAFNPRSRKCFMALWFGAQTVDPKVETALNGLIKWLASLSPEIIE